MSEGRLKKPQLRNLHVTHLKKSLGVMTVVTAIVGLTFKIFCSNVYDRQMEDFYKHYDAEKALKVMKEAGLLQSCPNN